MDPRNYDHGTTEPSHIHVPRPSRMAPAESRQPTDGLEFYTAVRFTDADDACSCLMGQPPAA